MHTHNGPQLFAEVSWECLHSTSETLMIGNVPLTKNITAIWEGFPDAFTLRSETRTL